MNEFWEKQFYLFVMSLGAVTMFMLHVLFISGKYLVSGLRTEGEVLSIKTLGGTLGQV